MIDPKILQALEHPNPDIRKKAIVALGKSKNAQAMPILAKVFKQDADPEVREYARKAGLMLKKSTSQPEASPPHVALAQEGLTHAMKLIADDKADKAIVLLRQAVAIDPLLRFDAKARETIHQVIGAKDETHSMLKLLGKSFTMADDYSQFQSQYYRAEQTLTYTEEATYQMTLRDIPPDLVQITVDIYDYKDRADDGIQFIKTVKRGGRTQKAYVIGQEIDEGEWLIKSAWIDGEADPVSTYDPNSKKQSNTLSGMFKRIFGQ
jgi:hypothetical protein